MIKNMKAEFLSPVKKSNQINQNPNKKWEFEDLFSTKFLDHFNGLNDKVTIQEKVLEQNKILKAENEELKEKNHKMEIDFTKTYIFCCVAQ